MSWLYNIVTNDSVAIEDCVCTDSTYGGTTFNCSIYFAFCLNSSCPEQLPEQLMLPKGLTALLSTKQLMLSKGLNALCFCLNSSCFLRAFMLCILSKQFMLSKGLNALFSTGTAHAF